VTFVVEKIKMNILDKIIERKKQVVTEAKSKISVEQLKDSEQVRFLF